MSACLFTVSMKGFDETDIETIKEAIIKWKIACAEFEYDHEQQASKFYQDQYSGYMDNIAHAEWYLKGYERYARERDEKF